MMKREKNAERHPCVVLPSWFVFCLCVDDGAEMEKGVLVGFLSIFFFVCVCTIHHAAVICLFLFFKCLFGHVLSNFFRRY